MDEPPDTPTPVKLPWEIAALRMTGSLLMFVGALALILGAVVWLMARDRTDVAEATDWLLWGLLFDVVGVLLRAVAGVWSALGRIAHRLDDPVSDEPVRRALLGIWESLTKK